MCEQWQEELAEDKDIVIQKEQQSNTYRYATEGLRMSRHDKPRWSHSWQNDKMFNRPSFWEEIDAKLARDKAAKEARDGRAAMAEAQENKDKDKRAEEIQRKNDEQILLQNVQFIDNHVYIDEHGQKYRRMSGGRFWKLPRGRSRSKSRSRSPRSPPIQYCPISFYGTREYPPAGGM